MDRGMDVLQQYIDEDQIPTEFGGKALLPQPGPIRQGGRVKHIEKPA